MLMQFLKLDRQQDSQKRRRQRALQVEMLEDRRVAANDVAEGFDVVRALPVFRRAETEVIQTGRARTIQVSGSIDTSAQEHSILRKTNLPGRYSGSVTIRPENGVLVQQFDLRQTFSGQTRLDDLELTRIAADIALAGNYRVATNRGTVGRVLSRDWRSSGTASVIVQQGPTRGVDYSIVLLATDDREFSNKIEGLSTAELVGASVRNASPVQSRAADWLGSRLTALEKLRIPGVDVQKAIGNYSILVDLFSTSRAKTNEQILADAQKAKWIIGVHSTSALQRYAEGGVTSIVGAPFELSKGFDNVLTRVPIATGSFFGGLVTASVGGEANIGVSISLAGVFAADSRGYGFTEGTIANVKLRVEALLTGNVAVIGFDRWSLVSADVKAGAFAQASFRVVVGSLNAKPEVLTNGAILYVTPNRVQRAAFHSYLSAEVTADVGAVLKARVRILGITIWKDQVERKWNVYSRTIVTAERTLRQ